MMTSPAAGTEPILSISGLSGGFRSPAGKFVEVLHDVSLSVKRAALTAIVGESGSGKTLTSLTILGLAPRAFQRTGGAIHFEGGDLLSYGERQLRQVRGARIAMVFQNSRSALNPVFTIGTQLGDVCRLQQRMSRKAALAMAEELLERVRVPDPRRRLWQYPHELSGGTVQRIQLAMALARRPALLLLDEPTTGLDVTIQADILDLIVELNRRDGMSTCMITHDLGVVAETCDEVVVMRAGEVCESGPCAQIMTRPQHPYTRQLLAASRGEAVGA